MIGLLFKCIFIPVGLMVLYGITFMLNCFTIPFYMLMYAGYKLLDMELPRVAFYGWMVYPRWSKAPRPTLWGDLKKMNKEADKIAAKNAMRWGRGVYIFHIHD